MSNNIKIEAIAASPGIGIGPIWILEKEKKAVSPTRIDLSEVNSQLNKLETAIDKCRKNFGEVKDITEDDDARSMIEAQVQMLNDPELKLNNSMFTTPYFLLLMILSRLWRRLKPIGCIVEL